jgi:hypothetical protein
VRKMLSLSSAAADEDDAVDSSDTTEVLIIVGVNFNLWKFHEVGDKIRVRLTSLYKM